MFAANTRESTPSHLTRPSIPFCGRKCGGNSEWRGLSESGHLRWKFGSICSDGKNDSEAAFFCPAGLNRNCLAAGELEGNAIRGVRSALASRPCWRYETWGIQHVAWLLWQSGETAQLFLPSRLAVAGQVLFLHVNWQSGVVSSFGTSQVKPWMQGHLKVLLLFGKVSIR